MNEPVPVIPLEYAPPEPERRWPWVLRALHALALLCCGVAWSLIVFVDVESVMATGPVLFALGVLLLVLGAVARDRRAVAFGASHVGVCLLFVFLVNLLNWSPGEAERPFTVMGALYTPGAWAAAAIFSVLRRPA